MADTAPQNPETLLIAHVTAHLIDGGSFELYPFVDPKDVKSKVSELAEGWAGSGFLLRGSRLVPWHQVKLLETTSVEEITRQEAQQRLMTWQAEDQLRAVQNFWKTKEETKEDGDKNEKGEGKGEKGGE
ncbi:hypothetical protein [Acidipila sp. EB88]|uniref:hypothetical protein n=1 Tax=Acidipila sp. EB88 TaxID=2305226 RepID=UPI000F5EAFE4|nr:hypothetical protein [Acidipila sp. EB88]RRA48112.1 hypothetical protein D1Y84_07235 [Acidipila sp. EB88]